MIAVGVIHYTADDREVSILGILETEPVPTARAAQLPWCAIGKDSKSAHLLEQQVNRASAIRL